MHIDPSILVIHIDGGGGDGNSDVGGGGGDENVNGNSGEGGNRGGNGNGRDGGGGGSGGSGDGDGGRTGTSRLKFRRPLTIGGGGGDIASLRSLLGTSTCREAGGASSRAETLKPSPGNPRTNTTTKVVTNKYVTTLTPISISQLYSLCLSWKLSSLNSIYTQIIYVHILTRLASS